MNGSGALRAGRARLQLVDGKLERQGAAESRGGHPCQLIRDAGVIRHDLVELLEGDLGRKPCDRRAEAGVHPAAETEMSTGPSPDVVAVRVRKLTIVAVARAVGEADEV